MQTPTSPTPQPLPDEVLKSYFDRGHQGDVDRTQIALLLSLTPYERLQKLDRFVAFLNRYTPDDAKLLRKRHSEVG
jgi:hypothetical protein